MLLTVGHLFRDLTSSQRIQLCRETKILEIFKCGLLVCMLHISKISLKSCWFSCCSMYFNFLKFVNWLFMTTIRSSCNVHCMMPLQGLLVDSVFYFFILRLNLIHRRENVKRASCETHKKLSHNTQALEPGGGEALCAEGHLPYALRVRPQTKARQCRQDSQPDASQRGGGELKQRGGGCVCRPVFVCSW